MLIPTPLLAAVAVLFVMGCAGFVWALARAAARPAPPMPDPVDEAYRTLPAGRPGLSVDTVNGSHDRLPIREDIRATLTAYCEGMWHHTQETP